MVRADGDKPSFHGTSSKDGLQLSFHRSTIARLAEELQQYLQDLPGALVRVIYKTGLSGAYDFTLHFGFHSAIEPDIFAAVESELGLRLEHAKVSVDTIVVDRAVKIPGEN